MEQQEGALLKQGDEFKASVWLTSEDVEVVIRLAEERDIPAGELIKEWILERIDEALDFDTQPFVVGKPFMVLPSLQNMCK